MTPTQPHTWDVQGRWTTQCHQCHTALVLWEETGTIQHAINTLRALGWNTQQTWPRGPWQTKCPDCLKPWTPTHIDITDKDTP